MLITEGIVSSKCELARLHREMNTLVCWNRSLPIMLWSGFTFRRIIRSAPSTFLLSVRKDEERNRKNLPLHSSNSRHNYCCHSLLQTVRPAHCWNRSVVSPLSYQSSEEPVVAFKSHWEKRAWVMTLIAEHYVREERDYGASELQRFDNAERVSCDIMRNGFEHTLRFTNSDDELYSLSSNYNLFHTTYMILILLYRFDYNLIQKDNLLELFSKFWLWL